MLMVRPMVKVSDFVLKLTKNCIIVLEKSGGGGSKDAAAVFKLQVSISTVISFKLLLMV